MNEPTGFYQVAYMESDPPLFRVNRADMSASDWISVKDLLREDDELRAKLELIASIAGNPDAAKACRLILKECE